MAEALQSAHRDDRDPSPVTQSESECEDAFGGLRVADLLSGGSLGSAPLPQDASLQEAAQALVSSNKSALAVAASESTGDLLGVLTENDVLRAYFEGLPPDLSVADWLGSGMARGSVEQFRRVLVRPQDHLAGVAARMTENLLSGDCACHHVVVQDADGRFRGVLSSLDLVHALCGLGSDAHPSAWQRAGPVDVESTSRIEESTVWSAMKRRNDVFTCEPGSSIKEVLKVMLLSGQNSVLSVDDQGVHGIVTPRDLLRAFVGGVRLGCPIDDLGPSLIDRVVQSDERLAGALLTMKERSVNHLVVVRPKTSEVVGLLSSLDAILSTRPQTKRAYSLQAAVGPAVSELVAPHRHFTAVCSPDETLASAAALLMTSNRTAAVVRSPTGAPLGLLTETDLARALCEGVPRGTFVRDWFWEREAACAGLHPHLVIRPSVRVTEAATLMTLMQSAADGGRGPCHHLVVQGADGEWLGLFSALDVVRAVRGLRSELEVSRTGADHARVAQAMKSSVPRCAPSDSLHSALSALADAQQSCALVEDEEGLHGVVTPRCAVQAMAMGTPADVPVSACLSSAEYRQVQSDALLVDAALAMATHGLHHLVVTGPGGEGIVGVLSSLDMVRGVASINSQCPFVSLRWLGLCRGRECCMIHGA